MVYTKKNRPENRDVENRVVESSPVRKKPQHRLGGFQLKLTAPQREGYYRRFVVDRPGRLEDAEAAGYAFVHDPKIQIGENPDDVTKQAGLDSRISKRVGNHADGTPMMAYLMEMPQDWYRENQDEKEKVLKERERHEKRNEEGWNHEDKQTQYNPLDPIRRR